MKKRKEGRRKRKRGKEDKKRRSRREKKGNGSRWKKKNIKGGHKIKVQTTGRPRMYMSASTFGQQHPQLLSFNKKLKEPGINQNSVAQRVTEE